ncbi:NACHT domain-containing NTPase [Streptomyces sp. NP-1717]|uniref:NACHT domain-containing protein n=1 Tax=Streptomyces sp. NP-1717 TaxID=2704470 RepID=UPI001F5C16D0|nr:NACHT domain-containing protein [Streptomyces sp. NP-1717]MCI3224794.1 NACHT domain-containing protein [Streptomyces sp. NP-1717]
MALLLAEEDLVTPDAAEAFQTSLFARIDGLAPLLNCYALGFPQVSRYDGQKLDTEQFVGTIKPGSSRMRDEYVVEGGGTPPAAREDGESPWAGMSGAPLFSGRHLIGVVTKDLSGWQHSRLTALPLERLPELPDFVGICSAYLGNPLRLATLRQTPDHSASFEDRYRAYVTDTFGELSIFGLDFSRSEHAQWPLDSAYLSLELVHGEGGEGAPPERGRVESALRDRQRVLLRGAAGSGKTTLVQWLAVNAARDSFPGQLTHLGGRIPVVLPLRTLVRGAALPAPEDFLSAAGHPLSPPAGWMESVLTEGRGLLLVDGVDEMPEADRARTKEWLVKLLAAYQHTAVVVTTRPTAVDDKWLSRKEFTEFQLLPMNRRDVTAFVRRWHTTARSITRRDSERSELDAYEQQLLSTLPRKQDLARLATNPLMCAMICALHRDRRGFLPDNRMKLYGAALTMLLVRRDHERAIGAPEGLTVAEEEQQKILQEIAYWMIRNEIAEAEQDDVIGLIARLLPAMPQVATPEDAPQVFRFLLHRSGLLRAPTARTVDFIHRTFLDYLGARAAVEAQDINMIASHAHEAQWEDIVRMAVGHARDSERAALLTKLMALGDAVSETSHNIMARIHLLAAASLEHATSLDPEVRTEVERRAAALIPPKNEEEANRLADAGPLVLDLLPGPEGLSDVEAAAVVRTAQLIGGEHALQVLREYATHPAHGVRVELVYSWASFATKTFAELVLAHIVTTGLTIAVHSAEQLAALHLVGSAPDVTFNGDLSPEGMAAAVRAVGAEKVSVFDNNRIKSLKAFAGSGTQLTDLTLVSCHRINDYSGVGDLGLEKLSLHGVPASRELSGFGAATNLRSLTLSVLGGPAEPGPLPLPAGLPVFPSVTRLQLVVRIDGDTDAGRLRALFPNLRQLVLHLESDELVTVDLSALNWVPQVRVSVTGDAVRVIGDESMSVRRHTPAKDPS